MNNLTDANEFIKRLITSFPEIGNEVMDEDYEGLLTLQVGVLTRFTQDGINTNNTSRLNSVFLFIDELLKTADHRVKTAIYTAFLEHLDFNSNRKAYRIVPVELKSAIAQLQQYHKSGAKDAKLNEFLKRNN